MNKTVLAIATVVAALSISATGFAQSQKGMENGKRKGWYKNGKIDKKHDSRYNQNRRDDNKRWDNDRKDDRWDSRNDSRYDSRYDNRNGSWRQTNDSRYNNSRYNDGRYNGSYQNQQSDRRQQTKNEWRNIAYGAGAVAILGLLQKDNRLVFGGAAGALYSLLRYEQDRKSQSSMNRAVANYFGNDHFDRDGVRYDRRLVNQNGQSYYQFVRAR